MVIAMIMVIAMVMAAATRFLMIVMMVVSARELGCIAMGYLNEV